MRALKWILNFLVAFPDQRWVTLFSLDGSVNWWGPKEYCDPQLPPHLHYDPFLYPYLRTEEPGQKGWG